MIAVSNRSVCTVMSQTSNDLGSAGLLRIAVVSQYFYPEDFRINDLVVELVLRGHEVHVLTGNPNYPSGKFSPGYGGIRTRSEELFGAHVIRVPHTARGDGSGMRLIFNYVTFAISAILLGPFLMRGRFDVVFTNQLSPVTVAAPALLLAKIKNAPAVMWVQDLWPQTLFAMNVVKGAPMVWIAEKGTSLLHRGMDSILVQSPAFRGPIEEQGVEPSKIQYAPNWAEDFYQPVDVPADATERASFGEGFNAVFAGNIGEAQSIETIVGAMQILKDLPDLNWVILGDGRKFAWLEQQVESLDLTDKVRLVGRKPVQSMPTWFALADVLVATLQPDPVFDSTIPSKLQSYLACGRPIVAGMDGEGARVIRESGAGATAPAGDEQALANAVRIVYESSKAERETMGRHAQDYYLKHFARNEVINHIESILVDNVNNHHRKDKI